MSSSAQYILDSASLCCPSRSAIGVLETFCHAHPPKPNCVAYVKLRVKFQLLLLARRRGGYFHLVSISLTLGLKMGPLVAGVLNRCETCTNASINQNVISL